MAHLDGSLAGHLSSDTRPTWRAWLGAALIVITVLVLFWPVVSSTKSWDDDMAIFANPLMMAPAPVALRHIWLGPQMDLYIPLTFTMWWTLARLGFENTLAGPTIDPQLFHAANLFIHVVCALAVFVLLRRLLSNDWAACAGALLFAIHPVQVEPVAWISGTKDLLCGLFCVVALHQYIHAVSATKNRWWHYAAAMVAFLAAVLSKPTAVVLPLILLTIDALVLRRPMRRVILDVVPFAALSALGALWTLRVQSAASAPALGGWHLRPLVAADALAFYLFKLLVPVQLAIDYGRTPAVAIECDWIWWTWITLLPLVVLVVLTRRRAPLVAAGAIVFVASLLPVLGFLRFDFQFYSTVSDRYLYLSMLGVALGAASLLAKPRLPAAWVFATIVLLALAWRAHDQARTWRTTMALLEHTLAVNPRSWSSANMLATMALTQRQYLDAEAQARRALDAGGDNWHVRLGLAQALERQRRLDEAVVQFEWVVRDRPDLLHPRVLLASAYLQKGRIDEGLEQLNTALEINPHDPAARYLMQQVIANRGAITSPTSTPTSLPQ